MASWNEVVEFARAFDGVEVSLSYGEPSLKVGKALLTRHRAADDSIVLKGVDPDERDTLIARSPDVFFLEDHYAGYDIVLARLAAASLDQLTSLIERTWRILAPKRSVKAYDERNRQQ
jgi:hypothetical protein